MATYVLCPLSTFIQVMAGATNPATGTPLSGGLVWTYAAGTSTPTPTYTDSTGSTPNSNPIQLNTYGQLANVNIYQPAGTKIKVQFSTNAGTVGSPVFGTQVGPTFDNVLGIGDNTAVQTTYYGGTDTGSANAYILNFTANFLSYINGTVIYWIPANTNTGASTLNVNGLGALNITYANGNALAAGQIIANQITIVAVSGGAFIYLGSNPTSTAGTATFTGSGFNPATNFNATYTIAGNVITLRMTENSGTSSATSFSMVSNNSAIFAAGSSKQWVSIPAAQDNGAAIYEQTAVVSSTGGPPATGVTITFYKNNSATGWTASGAKGVGDGVTHADTIISYSRV